MFQQLTERFGGLWRKLRGQGVLTEKHLAEASAEVREALLAADVHHSAVEQFLTQVNAAVVGQSILQSVQPAEQYLKAVYDTLVTTLGGQGPAWSFGPKVPAVILLVGLQGSGKTTTAAKLAHWAKQQGKRPLLVPVDLARPAAIAQLQALGAEWQLPVFPTQPTHTPVTAARAALEAARIGMHDLVIIDTAGRLHVDQPLMQELQLIAGVALPTHTLLVVDAMAGQQGLVAAEAFHQATSLTGVIVSKLDGDARGGVALSCASVLKVPICFTGVGEKVDALEPFYADRMASRILDMGDLATLAEKVAALTDKETTLERVRKLSKGQYSLEDFREQLGELKKMDRWEGMLKLLPGAGKLMNMVDMDAMRAELKKKNAIIDSMTLEERGNVRLLNGSRRKRIALGSGVTVTDVNRLVKEFEMMQKMAKSGGKMPAKMAQMAQMFRQ